MGTDLRQGFHAELEELRNEIARVGSYVVELIPRVTEILLAQDLEGAEYVLRGDGDIDVSVSRIHADAGPKREVPHRAGERIRIEGLPVFHGEPAAVFPIPRSDPGADACEGALAVVRVRDKCERAKDDEERQEREELFHFPPPIASR